MAMRSESVSSPTRVSRRAMLRWIALSPLAFATAVEAGRPGVQGTVRIRVPSQHEPTAGDWKTWLIRSASDLLPPAPPGRSSAAGREEFRELLALQGRRSDQTGALVQLWDPQGGVPVWSQILLATIRETRTNPVRASRALALLYTAMADATIATWEAKFTHNRLCPPILDPRLVSLSGNDAYLPSYPSEHAAVSAAAAAVLNYLYPGRRAGLHGQRLAFDEIANEASLSRLWSGANYRSDLDAGIRIGQLAGQAAVARGQSDGSSAVWDANAQPGRLVGPQYWVPTPPAFAFPPLEPLAGSWKPWVLDSPGQFRPPAPPALEAPFPSPRFLAETAEVKRTVDNLTPDQRRIALFWADNPGESFTPPGHWAQIATDLVGAARLSTPRAARALALVGVGLADSAIACWECKFTYWILRPVTAIRMLAGQPFHDPSFVTPIPTPPFPAYTSGHSTFSGSAAAVLEYLFPGGKVEDAFGQRVGFAAAADQAAVSRLYGGIHYRSDNDEGLVCGRSIADVVVRRAQSDGAP